MLYDLLIQLCKNGLPLSPLITDKNTGRYITPNGIIKYSGSLDSSFCFEFKGPFFKTVCQPITDMEEVLLRQGYPPKREREELYLLMSSIIGDKGRVLAGTSWRSAMNSSDMILRTYDGIQIARIHVLPESYYFLTVVFQVYINGKERAINKQKTYLFRDSGLLEIQADAERIIMDLCARESTYERHL